jgi:hypothetical protein
MDTDGHGFKCSSNSRQVLDCGNPLPLFHCDETVSERQKAGALQDVGTFYLVPRNVFIRVNLCPSVVK